MAGICNIRSSQIFKSSSVSAGVPYYLWNHCVAFIVNSLLFHESYYATMGLMNIVTLKTTRKPVTRALSSKKHISVLKTECREALNRICVVAYLKVGMEQRHAFDAVPGHCMLQAGLVYGKLHCVWHNIEYQLTTTGQHSQLWIETGIGSIPYQTNFQPVHRGQSGSFGGTSLKAIHALHSENVIGRTSRQPNYPNQLAPKRGSERSFEIGPQSHLVSLSGNLPTVQARDTLSRRSYQPIVLTKPLMAPLISCS